MKKYAMIAIVLSYNLVFAQSNLILKGSDVESRILRPAPMSAPITKKEYEENLKKQGKTITSEMKRINKDNDKDVPNLVSPDGFIDSQLGNNSKNNKIPLTGSKPESVLGVPRVNADGKIDINEAKVQQSLQQIENAKKESKLDGVEEGGNAIHFDEIVDEKFKKSNLILKELEILLYTKQVLMSDYEKIEKQIQIMNILIDTKYSKEINKKAELVKVRSYFLMRQMLSLVLGSSLKSYNFYSLGDGAKVLKIYSKLMSSRDVLALKSVTENAFSIGFEKVVFTNNTNYVLEENIITYMKKIKTEKVTSYAK